MKHYTLYVCEKCGYESKDYDDMKQHEASHLGLTMKELESYNALKSLVARTSSIAANKYNEETRRKFNEAVEKLVAFEIKHGIKT